MRVETKKKHKITTIVQVKVIRKKYSKLETMILTLTTPKTAFALHEKTLSEDEMNNIDTARKRTVTSVTTGKERKRKAP